MVNPVRSPDLSEENGIGKLPPTTRPVRRSPIEKRHSGSLERSEESEERKVSSDNRFSDSNSGKVSEVNVVLGLPSQSDHLRPGYTFGYTFLSRQTSYRPKSPPFLRQFGPFSDREMSCRRSEKSPPTSSDTSDNPVWGEFKWRCWT